jgi:hypothetical protein
LNKTFLRRLSIVPIGATGFPGSRLAGGRASLFVPAAGTGFDGGFARTTTLARPRWTSHRDRQQDDKQPGTSQIHGLTPKDDQPPNQIVSEIIANN